MNLAKKIAECAPKKGQIGLFWLGQAGFLIKNSEGKLLALDVYMSNLSERLDGNKRIMVSLLEPDEIEPDVVAISHYHTDHLDVDSLPTLLRNENARMFCDVQSYELSKEFDMPMDKLQIIREGETVEKDGFKIEAVFADHGDTAVEALAYVIETEGVKLYFPSDTSFQCTRQAPVAEKGIDIMIAPINGEYGNMNERDAAMLANVIKPKLTIPSHFWTFARHRGNPYDFQIEMKANYPDLKYYVMSQGELMYYPQ